MFGLIGKIISTPIRVVAAPLDAIVRMGDDADGGPRTPKCARPTAPLHALADVIDEAFDERKGG